MKYKVEIAPLANHYVVAYKDPLTLKVKKAMTLNRLGTDILRAFIDGVPQNELVSLLSQRYDATIEEMAEQVATFYSELQEE